MSVTTFLDWVQANQPEVRYSLASDIKNVGSNQGSTAEDTGTTTNVSWSRMSVLPGWPRRYGLSGSYIFGNNNHWESMTSNVSYRDCVSMVVELTEDFDFNTDYGLWSNGGTTQGTGGYISSNVLRFSRIQDSTTVFNIEYELDGPGTYIFHFIQASSNSTSNYLLVNGEVVGIGIWAGTNTNGTGNPRIGSYALRDPQSQVVTIDNPPNSPVIISELCLWPAETFVYYLVHEGDSVVLSGDPLVITT